MNDKEISTYAFEALAEEFDRSVSQIKRIIYRGCDIIFQRKDT